MPMTYGYRSLTDTGRGRMPIADGCQSRTDAVCGATPIEDDWNETPAAAGEHRPPRPRCRRASTLAEDDPSA